MNTPSPCNKCKYLYYDAMSKNSSQGYVECLKGLTVVERNKCLKFKNWDEK